MAVCRQGGRASQKEVPTVIFGERENMGSGAVSQQGSVLCDGSMVLTFRYIQHLSLKIVLNRYLHTQLVSTELIDVFI